ncbi:large ribosomal subunit protein mL50-like [Ornithodoros turicata]|uniref:large ribosomal subunit protein mL50-like n=1 Tax=Ornithodoros turicata TaxID=34597 RepID=UPI00313A465E
MSLFWRSRSAVLAKISSPAVSSSRHMRYDMIKKQKPFKRKDEDGLPLKVAAQQALASLAARGFCRPTKSYEPPQDVEPRLQEICKDALGGNLDASSWKTAALSEPLVKYKLLTRCIKEFKHDIPNSCLMNITSVADLLDYLTTPVQGTSPYDQLVHRARVPPNLHAVAEPVRFHPETDTFFNGVSAFPGSSTIVTGLKAKKKFRGFTANPKWPFV